MKTIYYVSGITQQVTNEVAETIKQQTIKGCGNFQSFSDENDKLLFVINISNICYIA